jgi:hypothetical protein
MEVSEIRIIKGLATLAILCILVAPAPASPKAQVHIKEICPFMSDGCKCPHGMNCSGKCSNSPYSQGSTCQISLLSSYEASNQSYSYFSKGSSNSSGHESRSTNSSHSIDEGTYPRLSQVNFNGIGPPDLDVIEYLPPSAKLVFDILASDGPLTQKDLKSKTHLHTNTIRYALVKLKEESPIKECFYFPDARQSLYGLSTATFKAGRR